METAPATLDLLVGYHKMDPRLPQDSKQVARSTHEDELTEEPPA